MKLNNSLRVKVRAAAWLAVTLGLLMGALAITPTDAAAQADVHVVTIDDYMIDENGMVIVEIALNPADGQTVTALQLDVVYDTSLFQLVPSNAIGASCLSPLSVSGAVSIACNEIVPGRMRLALTANLNPPAFNGLDDAFLATVGTDVVLTFKLMALPAAVAGDMTALEIAMLNDPSLVCDPPDLGCPGPDWNPFIVVEADGEVGPLEQAAVDGSITIIDNSTPTPTPSSTSTSTPTSTATATVTATPSITPTATITTTPTVTSTPSITPTVPPGSTSTPTPTPTATGTPGPSSTPTSTVPAGSTSTPTAVASATSTPAPGATSTPTPIVIATSAPAAYAASENYPGPFTNAPSVISGQAAPRTFTNFEAPDISAGTTSSAVTGNTASSSNTTTDAAVTTSSDSIIAVTGSNSNMLATVSLSLMMIGGLLMVVSRRRSDDHSAVTEQS